MTAAARVRVDVAAVRARADAGDLETATDELYELADADRRGVRRLAFEERIRWWEAAGAVERGGYDLRAAFARREEGRR